MRFRVRPADIGMDTGEPDLLDGLAGQLRAPKIISKIAAAFVDGDGVASIGQIRILRSIGKLQRIPDPADRTHRVPDSHKVEGTITTEGCLEACSDLEGMSHAAGAPTPPGVKAGEIRNEAIIARGEQSEHMENAAQSARGVGAAAEAEQEDFVAIFINVHQIAISIAHIGQQTGSKG